MIRFCILKKEQTYLESVIEYDLKTTGQCKMSLMKTPFYRAREAFALPKNSSYLKLINHG